MTTIETTGKAIDLMVALKESLDNSPAAKEREAIRAIVTAGERMALAHATVQNLADGRAIEKSFAIRRLMATMNDDTGKPHSASSAEKVVELDAEFMAYRRAERDAEIERHRSIAAFESAKLMGALEVEVYKAWERQI